jgi:hypothetical protein
METFTIVENILRARQKFFSEIRRGIELEAKIRAMLIASYVFLAIFGLVLGAGHSIQQAAVSMIKLPAMFLLTLAVCAPSLHYLNILFGSRQTILQTLALVLTGIATTAVLLFSFAPISLFFLMTSSRYEFYKVLNFFFCTLAGLLGVGFLREGLSIVTDAGADSGRNRRRLISLCWVILFAFVGGQMTWTLRPFMGDPSLPFILFSQRGGNIYSDVLATIGQIFGAH